MERCSHDLEWPAIEGGVRLFQSIDRYVPTVDPADHQSCSQLVLFV
jgi:hypothetical protein